jgi:hypothetical protein
MKLVAGIVFLPSRWPEGSASYRRFKDKRPLAGHGIRIKPRLASQRLPRLRKRKRLYPVWTQVN